MAKSTNNQTPGVDPAIAKTLKQIETIVAKQRKLLDKYAGSWKKIDTQIKAVSKSVAKFTTIQKRLSQQMKTSTQNLRKNSAELKRNARAASAGARGGGSRGFAFGRGGIGLGSIASTAGIYGIFRQFQKQIESQISAALVGGPGLGLKGTKAREFFARAIQDNLALQFGGSKDSTRAIQSIFEKTKFLPAETSGQLMNEFLKGFQGESGRQSAFLKAVNEQGPESAIKQFANSSNIQAANQLVNALALGGGAGDAGDRQAVTAAEAFNRLNTEIDKLVQSIATTLIPQIEKLAPAIESALQAFAQLPASLQTALAGGALLSPGLSGFAGGLVGGSAGKLAKGLWGAGKAGGRSVTAIGRGLGSLPFGAALAHASQGLGALAPGALAVGAPAVAAGSLWTLGRSIQTARDERTALGQLEQNQGRTGLFDIANMNKERATTELEKIRAKRQGLEANLLASPVSTGMSAGWFSPDLPEADPQQIARLREQIATLKKQEQDLRARANEASQPVSAATGTFFSDVIAKGIERIKEFGGKVKDFAANAQKAAVDLEWAKRKAQAIKLEDAKMNATLAGTETQLAALNVQLASIGFLGTLGAQNEIQTHNQAIRREIEKQTEILQNIDGSSTAGAIEQNRVRAEILNLRIQEKQNNRMFAEMLKGALISESLNAGRFEKILITQEKNLGIGLANNLVKQQPLITGSLPTTPNYLEPTRINLDDVMAQMETAFSGGRVVRAKPTSNRDTKLAQLSEVLQNQKNAVKQTERLIQLEAGQSEGPEQIYDRQTTFARNL